MDFFNIFNGLTQSSNSEEIKLYENIIENVKKKNFCLISILNKKENERREFFARYFRFYLAKSSFLLKNYY